MSSFIYWCERVRKSRLSPPWQKIYNSPLANYIKCSDYFDKFSLLTHTDEQNLYLKIVKVARTDKQIKLVT
jgi:hypothetical protein